MRGAPVFGAPDGPHRWLAERLLFAPLRHRPKPRDRHISGNFGYFLNDYLSKQHLINEHMKRHNFAASLEHFRTIETPLIRSFRWRREPQ